MRYVLWSGDPEISVSANDMASKYMFRVSRNWRTVLGDLAIAVMGRDEGKITSLEIQAHGNPATIYFPRENITWQNVADFGAMLRPMMAPGSLIEIMACKVAAVSPAASGPGGTLQYGSAVLDAYWGGMLRDPVALLEIDNQRPQVITLTGDALARRQDEVAKGRAGPLKAEYNGLEFCLTMARMSGATVRAARLKQVEEIGSYEYEIVAGIEIKHIDDHPIMRDYDRAGNWEGPVWDFLPSGEVKYLGCNVPRHLHHYPEHRIGPPLANNLRDKSANHAGGQRPQRLNRAPLPV